MAVQRLFPETRVTIGPATDTGLYYDLDRAIAFTPGDLTHIAAEMQQIIRANLPRAGSLNSTATDPSR
jgi:threonyl-tRNA synthetase